MRVTGTKLYPLMALVAFAACTMKQTALADSSSVQYGRGGSINEGDIIKQHGKTGELLRIEGSCQSSCTMLLAAKNACVDPGATLYFHAAITTWTTGRFTRFLALN
jgi:hypothetical protein